MQTHPSSPLALRLCIMLLVALEFLQNGMLALGAPSIIQGLNGSPQAFSLAAAIYASVAIMLIVKHRWLAESLGYRKYVLGSLALYMVGALACGLATDMLQFSIARALQALGGATFFTAARMQVNLFSGPARLVSLRLFVMGIFAGSMLAPVLCAWLLAIADWRWLFWIMLLPSLAAMGMTARLLPEKAAQQPGRSLPHVGGLLMLTAAVFLLQFMLERLPYELLQAPRELLLLGGLGSAGITAFVVHEWHRPNPLLGYRHFINRRYVSGIAVFFFCYLVAASNGYILPLLLSHKFGMSLQQAGWWLAVPFLVCMGTLNLAISLANKYPGARKFLQASLLLLTCYAAGMLFMPAQMAPWHLALLLIVFGASSTFGMEAAAQTALKGIDTDVFSDAYQTKNIVREVALACGIALATLFGETGHTLPLSTVPGVNGTSQGYFLVLAAGALLLLLLTTGEGWVRRWRARATALAATGRA